MGDELLRSFHSFKIVRFKMYNKCLRFVLGFHNVCGTLNLKVSESGFSLSHYSIIRNILKIALIIISNAFITVKNDFFNSLVKTEFSSMDYFSVFNIILLFILNLNIIFIALFIISINLWKRNDILEIFTKSVLMMKLDETLQKKFQKCATKNCVFVITYLVLILLKQFFLQMKFSLFSLLMTAALLHPYLVLFNFLCFKKNSEIFFIMLLKQNRKDLKRILRKNCFDRQLYEEIVKRHQNIFELNKEYLKIFGAQITIVTCFTSLMLITQVSLYFF